MQEHIDGYPTLVLYDGGQRIGVYEGIRNHLNMFEYLKRKSGDVFIPISMLEEIQLENAEVGIPDLEDTERALVAGKPLVLVLGLFPPTPPEEHTAPDGSITRGIGGPGFRLLQRIAGDLMFARFLIADNIPLLDHFEVMDDTVLIFTGGNNITVSKQ
jgi:hypothetical protein